MFKFKVLQPTRFSTFNFGELRKKRKKKYHTSGDLQFLTQQTKGLSAAGRKC